MPDPNPLPVPENALRMRLLLKRFGQVAAGKKTELADPCVGLNQGLNDLERMAALREALND